MEISEDAKTLQDAARIWEEMGLGSALGIGSDVANVPWALREASRLLREGAKMRPSDAAPRKQ